jgi:hypothetical protein
MEKFTEGVFLIGDPSNGFVDKVLEFYLLEAIGLIDRLGF